MGRLTRCPHASDAMVAAGFPICGACEDAPAPAATRDPLAAQRAAMDTAYANLGITLDGLATEARAAARLCARKRPPGSSELLARTRAAIRDLDAAEQAVDTAAYDLSTAGGEDG